MFEKIGGMVFGAAFCGRFFGVPSNFLELIDILKAWKKVTSPQKF